MLARSIKAIIDGVDSTPSPPNNLGCRNGRGRNEDCSSPTGSREAVARLPTGSSEAVARLRLPQNVACGFTALRSSIGGSQFSLLFVQVSFPWSADLLFAEKAVSPVEWSPCCPRTIRLQLTASPCGRLSRPPSTISQYDFHSVVRPPSPCRLVGPYKLAFEPNGSPVFTLIPLVACWRYQPRKHPRPLALLRGLRFRLPL